MSDASDSAFREMSEDDQATAAIIGFSCGEAGWHGELNEYIRSGEALRHGRKSKQATLLWCRDGGNGDTLGYACVRRRLFNRDPDIPSLLITHLALDQKHQRQGHGEAMLDALVQFAISGGAKVIELFVHEENVQAISRYRKSGSEFLPGQVYVDEETGDRYPAMVRGV